MIIGIPKEIKNGEYRVSVVPAGVKAFVDAGHAVVIERGAGTGSGISDTEFVLAGAVLADSHEEVFGRGDMIIKVKEPLPAEYPLLREGQVLFTYLHLAPVPELTRALLDAKIVGIAYETIESDNGTLPLLTPMSEIAGRMAVHVGSYFLHNTQGGRGVLLGGVPGVEPGKVVILGGGVVGTNAAQMAAGTHAEVYVFDTNLDRLRYLDDIFGGRIRLMMSDYFAIEKTVSEADLLVGGVLITGATAPKLVTAGMVSGMNPGSVIVDVSIDQGGCIETARPTTHDDPVYTVDGVLHYCVTNMPGTVARTSTFALTNTTLSYALKIAELGYEEAMKRDHVLKKGLNVCLGKLTCKAVADSQGVEYTPVEF